MLRYKLLLKTLCSSPFEIQSGPVEGECGLLTSFQEATLFPASCARGVSDIKVHAILGHMSHNEIIMLGMTASHFSQAQDAETRVGSQKPANVPRPPPTGLVTPFLSHQLRS